MANIISIGTAVPPFVATQDDAKDFATNLYGETYKGNLDRLISIFENTLIKKAPLLCARRVVFFSEVV